jgi:hypothetical protein
MKFLIRPSSLLLLGSMTFSSANAAGVEVDFRRYAVPTEQVDWDECALEYTQQCPPTISIEQAACEAPLVVNGRVLQAVNGETKLDTVVQIQVEYRSEFFGSIDRKTIQKWGAGLENDEGGSVFTNSSGFFTTWVSGFNNTPTDLAPAGYGTTPCGTRAPRSQESLFFFLKGLPENEGKKVEFEDDGVSLNVNFTLAVSMLQSGHVEDNTDTYRLVDAGAFGDDNLLAGEGMCEAVYCCYNRDCPKCAAILEQVKEKFQCADTFTEDSSANRVFGVTAARSFRAMIFGMMVIAFLSPSDTTY